ncbi:MAG: hypothetical protein IPI67_39225 [Myxococcales bacterium]|nr:hypothetical protein [Myxococcales bacterium]
MRTFPLLALCLLAPGIAACSSDDDGGGVSGGGGADGSATGGGAGSGAGGAASGGTSGSGGSGGTASGGVSGGGGSSGAGGTAIGGTGGSSGAGGSGGSTGGASGWPAPSACEEGTTSQQCGEGVAEASCPDQVTFFDRTLKDTATTYWELPKPKAGFRMADKFAQGNAYLRLEVLNKPTNIEIFPQVCAWRWDPKVECKDRWKVFAETCSSQNDFSYTQTGVSYVALGSPAKWWQKATPAWSYALPWDALRILQKAVQNGNKYLLQDAGCGTACWPVAGGAAAHMPIDMRGELVLVAQGKTLKTPAHWTGCTASFCK